MGFVSAAIDARGGFATTRELKALGISEYAITRSVRNGEAKRVRNGVYSTRSVHDPEFRAVRVGGRLTGLSALALRGCWIWQMPTRLQVAVDAHATRLQHRATAVDLHWEQHPAHTHGGFTSVGVAQALIRVVLDESLETSVACFDWALHTGYLSRFQFEELLLGLPEASRSIRHWVDGNSQSVLESVARVRLRSRGWRVRSQARLGDIEAIDLVIEDVIALELDGREFHQDSFDHDRLRDLRITIEGRHSIRVSMSIVREHWQLVEDAIAAALAARRLGDGGNSGTPPSIPHGSYRRLRRTDVSSGVSDE